MQPKAKRNKVQHEKSAARKKAKNETYVRWEKCNTEKLLPEKSATRKITTLKKCNMEKMQLDQSATKKIV